MSGTDLQANASPKKTWLLLCVDDDQRQHGGNAGYNDDPSFSYEWDDTVPNGRAIQIGDRIVLWNKRHLLGVSVVDAIESRTGPKLLYRCAVCNRSKIKPRSRKTPKFKCHECGSEFEEPRELVRPDTTFFRSNHGRLWQDMNAIVDGASLRGACISPNSQLSIREMDGRIVEGLLRLGSLEAEVRSTFAPSTDGHSRRWVRTRKGQSTFRDQLLKKYGSNCALSGPNHSSTLDACHLYSYAVHGVHERDGGLLLRADIHRLLDNGLLGVDPQSGAVVLGDSVKDLGAYEMFDGQPLTVKLTARQRAWIRIHWAQHFGAR